MVTVVRDAEGITVKDDEGKELEGFFCPFAGEMCYEGDVVTEAGSPKGKCRFWSTDQPQAPRCGLEPAIGGLAAISAIPGVLQTLASRGGE